MDPPAAKRARNDNSSVNNGSGRRVGRHQRGPKSCACCGNSITSDDDHVQNIPCNHDVCLLCVVKSNMKRGSNPACCQVEDCQNKYTTMCQYYNRGSPRELIKNEVVGMDRYKNRYLPMHCLLEDHRAEIMEENTDKRAAVIYVGSITKGGNRGKCSVDSILKTIVLEKTEDGYYDYADDVVDNVRAIFARMHPIIIPPSKPNKPTANPVLSAREYLEQRIMYPPLLLHALYGLSTGIVHFDKVKQKIWMAGTDPSHQNQFLAAAGAADMLMRSNDRSPNSFQLMLGEYLNRFTLSKEVQSLLSALQLTPSQNFSLTERSKKVMDQLQKGITIGPRDLPYILADNIGFKKKGDKAAYDQHTIVNIHVVPEAKLRAAGFYNDDPTKRLSRDPNLVWGTAIDEAKGDEDEIKRLIDLIVGLNGDDYNRLGESVMEDILLAVEYTELLRHNVDRIVGKKMPRLDRICNEETREKWDIKLRESEQEKHQHERRNTSSSPPTQATVRNSVPIPRDTASESADLNPKSKNRYDLNDASLEPLHEDLAKNVTQQKLMEYITSTCQRQVEEFDKMNYPATEERPVAEIFACLGVDGQPAAACHQILAHDATSEKKYPKHLLVSAGGFHYGMKILNANGELFEQALDMFLSAWRDTKARGDWFKFPSDPRQREKEHPFYLLAHYVNVVVQLSGNDGIDEVSAHDVYEFMLQRAKEYPLCMLVLLEMRLATVAKMLKNAERIGERGSVELFLTAVKFAMRLFAITHKTDYMRLSCNILLWWNCASDAQKKIYSSFIFTQLTSNGVPIYHDLSVELSVKDLRKQLGKVYKKGLDLYMEHACVTIPERNAQELEATELRNKDTPSQPSTSKSYSTIPEDFFKMYSRIREMDLWAPGKAPILARPRGGDILYAQTNRLEVPVRDGGAIHASILESITISGEERVRNYFIKNYIDFNNRPVRSETDEEHGVSLSKMKSTVKQLIAEKDLRKRRATVSTKAEVKKVMKIDDIIEEYNKLRTDNKQLNLQQLPRSGLNHDGYADKLAQARRKLFKKTPRLKERIINDIDEEYANNELSTEENRALLLKDKLFTFPQSTTSRDRYTKKINVMAVPM